MAEFVDELAGPGGTTTTAPLFGKLQIPGDDPAWQPITDPLKSGDIRARAQVINREIPNPTIQTGWDITAVRAAIQSLVTGNFDQPAQLVDALGGDSRVQSAMQSRVGGLLGREIRHQIPAKYKDSALAKECLDAWVSHWPSMSNEPMLADMLHWSTLLGFWIGQILWDTTTPIWKPHLVPFHPRYTYYHWMYRRYVLITMDGQVAVEPGNSHFVLHAPYGRYRGWMRGSVRAIAPWWLARNYALRDEARYSERHGMPIGLAITPSGADAVEIQRYRDQVSQLGQESVIQLPQSQDPTIGSYDFKWLETTDGSYGVFQQLISQCNAEITLSVLGQNLTSEVKEGSFAAARVHADVRQAILEADGRAITETIYTQIARPFAALNFGDPDLAPRSNFDIIPYEDNKANADTFAQFAIAVSTLKSAGLVVTDINELARQFGLSLTSGKIEGAISKEQSRDLITPTDLAAVVTVNEARANKGFPPMPDGELTVAQYKAQAEAQGQAEGEDLGGEGDETKEIP